MQDLYHNIVLTARGLLAHILRPHLDLDGFLAQVARSARQLDPDHLEARVYEVDFIENRLLLRTSTKVDVATLKPEEKVFEIKPKTITGDAVIENRLIIASKDEGYAASRFKEGEAVRAAFPIEFFDPDMPEGRTKYVLVVDKKGKGPLDQETVSAMRDYSGLAGLVISIKELRDRLSEFYEDNRNLVLTGRHSAAIAHDIRSLNIGVAGFLNMVLRRLEACEENPELETVKKHLVLARDNSSQIEALLKNFALFTRPEVPLQRDTDLAFVVATKLEALKSRADFGRQVDFELSLPEDEVGFLVDEDWFGTVVENLVKNSIEACPTRARVAVNLAADQDHVVLTFLDNCGGIPDEMLPHIFTPFRSTKKRGQGLGLANARKVVEDHGGNLEVSSRPGQGAVFTIRFARDQAGSASPQLHNSA